MIEKDSGFVLNRYNFRETSLITNIYTLRFGKITGILKGFYTGKKEFSSPLEPASLNELIFYPKKSNIWLISYVDLIKSYPFLSNDFLKNKIAMTFINLVDKVMQPNDPNAEVFYLLKDSLEYLEKFSDPRIIYTFLIKFFTISGVKPQLDKCICCLTKLTDRFFFDVSRGGLVCNNCVRGEVFDINKETVNVFLYIQKNKFDMIFRLNISPNSIEEINYILEKFLLYHLEYKINLKEFIWKEEGYCV